MAEDDAWSLTLAACSNLVMRSKTCPMLISPELFLSKTLKTDWYSCLSILKSSNAELDEGGYWPPPPASIVIILVNLKL